MSSGTSSTDANVAVVALSVALAALFITLGQLLGQYFATADGYRRCQPSVMGSWAERTRLRWRWSQFRFETLFTTPEIALWAHYRGQKTLNANRNTFDEPVWITGSHESRRRTLVAPVHADSRNNELVCWIPFLRSLHQLEEDLERHGCYSSAQDQHSPWLLRPIIRFRERSWDFMSPEIVRPYAVSNVSDIAVLARRLGMVWVDFKPHDGVMRAEGNGHVLSSTYARSIGIILHYMHVGVSKFHRFPNPSGRAHETALYIPSQKADMMGFGIIPGYDDLSIPAFRVGTIGKVCATMDILDPSRQASKKIKDIRGIEPTVTFGFSDLIPMGTGMLRIRGSTVIRLPVPTEYCVGLTCHTEGFVVFHHRLMEYIAERKGGVDHQVKRILKLYEDLKAQHDEWENEDLANEQINDRSIVFLDKAHDGWDEATAYLVDLERNHGLRYYDLMATHITHAVRYWGDAWSNIREGKARHHYGLRDWVAEGAHIYWDYLPEIVTDMQSKGFEGGANLVHDAWITMMFRAFCWWRCHYIVPAGDTIQDQSRLPSRYWDSKLPVYIG